MFCVLIDNGDNFGLLQFHARIFMYTICSSNALPELSDCKPRWERSKGSIIATLFFEKARVRLSSQSPVFRPHSCRLMGVSRRFSLLSLFERDMEQF